MTNNRKLLAEMVSQNELQLQKWAYRINLHYTLLHGVESEMIDSF